MPRQMNRHRSRRTPTDTRKATTGEAIADPPLRQNVLVLYLQTSALDSKVVGWSQYDGTGAHDFMAGDSETPPYARGIDALRDGWRLFQASQLQPHAPGDEFRTAYLKYEFWFERLVAAPAQTEDGKS